MHTWGTAWGVSCHLGCRVSHELGSDDMFLQAAVFAVCRKTEGHTEACFSFTLPSLGISSFDMHVAFTPLVDVGNVSYCWLSWRCSKTLLSMLNCCFWVYLGSNELFCLSHCFKQHLMTVSQDTVHLQARLKYSGWNLQNVIPRTVRPILD